MEPLIMKPTDRTSRLIAAVAAAVVTVTLFQSVASLGDPPVATALASSQTIAVLMASLH
jgi:hypothetical protein